MIDLTPAETIHKELLARWRKAMDLVGPGPLEPHFEDAARAVSWLTPEGRWADLGSGAGFPGIALAARFPELQVELVESRQKRSSFLKQVVARADLKHATVRHCRSEVLPDDSYDGLISRAYRPPEGVMADAQRLLKPGGVVVLMLAKLELPPLEGFVLAGEERYAIEGKDRRAVRLLKQV